jgi:hypothetical protein
LKEFLEQLLARLNAIPGFNYVELFNNQLKDKANENLFFPALYLEVYGSVEYESGLGDYQYGNATIRIHVVNDSVEQGTDMVIYELKNTVHKYLQHYTTGYFTSLNRTREELDTNHRNLYDYKIDYITRFTELTTFEDDDESIVELTIKYDLYDDNDEIVIDKIN